MEILSSIKDYVMQVWRVVKATARVLIKLAFEVLVRLINLVLFRLSKQKKIQLQIFILRDENGTPVLHDEVSLKLLKDSLDFAIKTFKDKFDITINSYGGPIIQTLPKAAPRAALDVPCNGGAGNNEWGEVGEYFANNSAGWNIIPITLNFPITVFIVRVIGGRIGCSLGPMTDYITLSVEGTKSISTMAHGLAHCCGLKKHPDDINNLMYISRFRTGNAVTSWQKFIVRNSRHCTFW
jgi:hypothetical protein